MLEARVVRVKGQSRVKLKRKSEMEATPTVPKGMMGMMRKTMLEVTVKMMEVKVVKMVVVKAMRMRMKMRMKMKMKMKMK